MTSVGFLREVKRHDRRHEPGCYGQRNVERFFEGVRLFVSVPGQYEEKNILNRNHATQKAGQYQHQVFSRFLMYVGDRGGIRDGSRRRHRYVAAFFYGSPSVTFYRPAHRRSLVRPLLCLFWFVWARRRTVYNVTILSVSIRAFLRHGNLTVSAHEETLTLLRRS